jgi:transposase-like protein
MWIRPLSSSGALAIAPELAVGDGALGFWKALDKIFPGARHQRCWVNRPGFAGGWLA